MSRRQYTYETDIQLIDLYDEDVVVELNIVVDYDVAFGSPPSGMSGPPEHYDPGSGDEITYGPEDVFIYDASQPKSSRQKLEAPLWLREYIVAKLEKQEEHMIEQAVEA